MATKTKAAIDPDAAREMIEAKRASGEATLQELSHRAYVVDPDRFQPRGPRDGMHVCLKHCRELELDVIRPGLDRGLDLRDAIDPVVMWRIGGVIYLVGGFHRRHVIAEKMRLPSIWAWVVEGTEDEAKMYAAMSNRKWNCLKMTREDQSKAVRMVLETEEGWRMAAKPIAANLGVAAQMVTRIRVAMAAELNRSLPQTVIRADGKERPARQAKGHDVRRINRRSDGSFQMMFGGVRMYLGRDPVQAIARAESITRQPSGIDSTSLRNQLAARGVAATPVRTGNRSVYAVAECAIHPLAENSVSRAWQSVGTLFLLRHRVAAGARMIVVVRGVIDPHVSAIAALAAECPDPIEFMDLDAFLAEFAPGDDGEAGGVLAPA